MLNRVEQDTIHKLETNGNDFLIAQKENHTTAWIKKISNRHLGIGCDQVLIITKPQKKSTTCTFFNQDGSSAEMCLNGVYALAYFLHNENNTTWKIHTKHAIFATEILQKKLLIHIREKLINKLKKIRLTPPEHHTEITGHLINTGNDHLIIKTNNINSFPLEKIGRTLQNSKSFPNGVNVSAVSRHSNTHLEMRTFERGAGLTRACGSAGLAAFASHSPSIGEPILIKQPGGEVIFTKLEDNIIMEANCSYIGKITLNP